MKKGFLNTSSTRKSKSTSTCTRNQKHRQGLSIRNCSSSNDVNKKKEKEGDGGDQQRHTMMTTAARTVTDHNPQSLVATPSSSSPSNSVPSPIAVSSTSKNSTLSWAKRGFLNGKKPKQKRGGKKVVECSNNKKDGEEKDLHVVESAASSLYDTTSITTRTATCTTQSSSSSSMCWNKGFLNTNTRTSSKSNDGNCKNNNNINNTNKNSGDNSTKTIQNIQNKTKDQTIHEMKKSSPLLLSFEEKKNCNDNFMTSNDVHNENDNFLSTSTSSKKSNILLLNIENNEQNDMNPKKKNKKIKSSSPLIIEISEKDNENNNFFNDGNNLSKIKKTTSQLLSTSTSKSKLILPHEEKDDGFWLQERSSKKIIQSSFNNDDIIDVDVNNDLEDKEEHQLQQSLILEKKTDNHDFNVNDNANANVNINHPTSSSTTKAKRIISSSPNLPSKLSKLLSQLKKIKKLNNIFTSQQETLVRSFLNQFLKSSSPYEALTEANLRFIWDIILEKIATYAKDKSMYSFLLRRNSVTTSPSPTVISNDDEKDRNKSDNDNNDRSSGNDNENNHHCNHLLLTLPPTIYLSFSILEHCPQKGWHTLLNRMNELTHDMTNANNRKENNSSSNSSKTKNNSNSNSNNTLNQGLDIKKKKVQLLGMYVLIKVYICWNLHLLQEYLPMQNIKVDSHGHETNDNTCSSSSQDIDTERFRISVVTMSIIVKRGLPLIVQIIEKMETKRTLLTTFGMDCVMYLLEYTALLSKINSLTSDEVNNASKLIWDSLPMLKILLKVKMIWLVTTKNSNEGIEDKTNGVKSISRSGEDKNCFKAMKKQCESTVLNDWVWAINKAENNYNRSKVSFTDNEEFVNSVFIDDIGGSLLDFKLSHANRLSLGGVAQCIVSDYDSSRGIKTDAFLKALQAALHFMTLQEGDKEDNDEIYLQKHLDPITQEIHCLRGACTWISKKRDALTILKEESVIKEAINLCFLMLRSKSERSLNFILSILNLLWFDTNGLPEDILNMNELECDIIPESFTSLIQELNCQKNTESLHLEPSERVICDLVERCLIHCPHILLPFFFTKIQNPTCLVQILVSLLKKNKQCNLLSLKLCQDIENKLFNLLPSSKCLQKIVYSSPDIISYLPLIPMVQKTATFLQSDTVTDYAKSSSSKLLTYLIERNLATSSSEVVTALISSLKLKEGKTEEKAIKLLKYGESWRKALVHGPNCSDDDYASFLVAICTEMMKSPKNSMIFALFAAVIGDGKDARDLMVESSKTRILFSTIALVRLSLVELRRKNNKSEDSIFVKISPLLLLRRIPVTFYDLLLEGEENEAILRSLADVIAIKLGIENIKDESLCVATTVEERRLLAELVSRCFPFSNHHISHNSTVPLGFVRFCSPIFSSSLLKAENLKMSSDDWKKAKLSLYICCHAVQLKLKTLSLRDFEEMVCFAIKILRVQTNNNDALIELQTGCIDLLATCIESICASRSFEQKETHTKSLLEEIPSPASEKVLQSQSSFQYDGDFTTFKALLFHIINNDKKSYHIFEPSSQFYFVNDIQHWSTSSRTCILNAFTLVSKRCPEEALNSFSQMIVPEMIMWVMSGEIDENTRHPLCVAAVLQCLFTMLTRTKSFRPLQNNGADVNTTLYQIFQLSVQSIKAKTIIADNKYAKTALRIAAMKLLLVIVNIDQSAPMYNNKFLAPGDIAQALSIIRGAANVDEDSDVRQLASYLATVLQ